MSDRGRSTSSIDVTVETLEGAKRGEKRAWDELVNRYSGLVRRAIAQVTADRTIADDAFQETWLVLVDQLPQIQSPVSLPGLLTATARHSAVRLVSLSARTEPVDAQQLESRADARPDPLEQVLELLGRDTDREQLRLAFALLPPHCQRLLELLVAETPLSYSEIGAQIDVPVGSVGPTRHRCIEHLRRIIASRSERFAR